MTWADSIKAVLWIVSIAAILFLSAGTLDWPRRRRQHNICTDRAPIRKLEVP